MNNHKIQAGFSIIEVLLAVTLFGFLAMAMVGAIIYSQQSTLKAADHARAIQFADEGLNAVQSIRNVDFANLVDGTYGLSNNGAQWSLSGSPDVFDDFTRSVSITTIDQDTKDVEVTISWGIGSQISFEYQLKNWLETVIVLDWSSAILVNSVDLSGNTNARKVVVENGYAYLTRQSGSPNFYVIDINDTANPTIVGSTSLANNSVDIQKQGDYVYVASTSNNSEFQIVDVTNPASPSVVGSYNAPSNTNAYGVGVNGNYVYFTRASNNSQDEFYVMDVSNPSSPTLVGSLDGGASMRDVCVSGNYAYAVSDTNNQEFRVIDVSNPSSPAFVASLNLTGSTNPEAIYCESDRVLIGQGNNLRVIDISTPTSPTVVGSITTTGGGDINDISGSASENLVFLATESGGNEFQIVDVANPSSLVILQTVDSGGNLWGVDHSVLLDVVVGVGDSNSQEVTIYGPN